MKSKFKILIVEDEVAIAEDLYDILEMAGYDVVGPAYSYDQAMEFLAMETPHLCFLDIALKGRETGLDVADVLNEKYKIPFIFLTSFSDASTVTDVVSRNPGGYLVKPFKEKDIGPAVALALANDELSKKEVFPRIEFINKFISKPISAQEYNVLKLLWQGCKNAEIAESLFVSLNTIKSHVSHIYMKLEVNSRAGAINKIMNL